MLHCPHLIDAPIAVQLPEQRLLDSAPAHAVLGERAATATGHFAAELDDRLTTGLDVGSDRGMTFGWTFPSEM